MQVTSDMLAGAGGILLSLIFSYGPKVSTWYARLDPVQKRLLMLGCVTVVAAALFGLSCAGVEVFGVTVACTTAGAVGLVQSVVVCAITNQMADRMSPPVGPAAEIVKAKELDRAAAVAVAAVSLALPPVGVRPEMPDSGVPNPAGKPGGAGGSPA